MALCTQRWSELHLQTSAPSQLIKYRKLLPTILSLRELPLTIHDLNPLRIFVLGTHMTHWYGCQCYKRQFWLLHRVWHRLGPSPEAGQWSALRQAAPLASSSAMCEMDTRTLTLCSCAERYIGKGPRTMSGKWKFNYFLVQLYKKKRSNILYSHMI